MNFDQLRYFVGVAKVGHLSRAARILGISQSALSHSIAKLENQLETKLFERIGRGIQLNEIGRELLSLAQPLIEQVDSIDTHIKNRTGELHGYLKLAAPIGLSSYFVGEAWSKLHSLHPKLRAELRSLRSIEIVSRAISSEIDLGFCFGPQAHPFLESKKIAERCLLVVVRKSHPIVKLKKMAVKNLSNFPVALPIGLLGFGTHGTHPFFERFRIHPTVEFTYDNHKVAIHHVLASDSWCLLPDWIVSEHKDIICAVASSQLYEPLEISAVWPKNRPLSIAGNLLIDEVSKICLAKVMPSSDKKRNSLPSLKASKLWTP